MYVVLCTLLLLAGVSADDALPWWKTAILYQVYPRSFMDSDGDGIGDLGGITDRAQYFKDIGVTAIWLSPFYKSPMKDFGYDVSDYRDVEPTFGTLDDFKLLAKKLRELGIKLLIDIVPNHSSDQHEWFQKSIQKIDPYTDYYVWHDGKMLDNGTRVPPNNWMCRFDSSAWQWNEKRQQYYLHQFMAEQPDLDYRNPKVVKEIDDLMQFWLDLGVDGFRADTVTYLLEDKDLKDEQPLPGKQGKTWMEFDHVYTQNLPETYELPKHWAQLVFDYSKVDGRERAMWLETYTDLPHTLQYQGHGDMLLMQPFNYNLMRAGDLGTRAEQMMEFLNRWIKQAPSDNINNWVTENHENPRVPTRLGPEMVDPMAMLTGVLPGVKCVYYGEEIGMSDAYIRWDQIVDSRAIIVGNLKLYRDPMCTPMQWDNSLNAGFSTSLKTWLPVNPNYYRLNVDQQLKDPVSHLNTFRAIAEVRKDPILQRGNVTVRAPNNDTLLVTRHYNGQHMALVINMGSQVINYTSATLFRRYALDTNSTVIVSSLNSGISPGSWIKGKSMSLVMVPKSAVLLKSGYSKPAPIGTTIPPPPTTSRQSTETAYSRPPPLPSEASPATTSSSCGNFPVSTTLLLLSLFFLPLIKHSFDQIYKDCTKLLRIQ